MKGKRISRKQKFVSDFNARSRRNNPGLPDVGSQYALAAKEGARAVYELAPATKNFAKALHDPFSTVGMDVKLPMIPLMQTQTVVNYVQDLTVTTGVNGQAFVLVSPGAGICGDLSSVFYTTSGYLGLASTPLATSGTGIAEAALTSPYNCIAYEGATGLRARIISTGIQIQYVGSTFTGSGVVHSLANPDKATLVGLSHNDLGSYLHTRVDNVVGGDGGANTITLTRPMIEASDNRFLKFVSGTGFVYADSPADLSSDYSQWLGITLSTSGASLPFRVRVFNTIEVYGKVAAAAANALQSDDRSGVEATIAHHNSRHHSILRPTDSRRSQKLLTNGLKLVKSIGAFAMKHQSGIRMMAQKLIGG